MPRDIQHDFDVSFLIKFCNIIYYDSDLAYFQSTVVEYSDLFEEQHIFLTLWDMRELTEEFVRAGVQHEADAPRSSFVQYQTLHRMCGVSSMRSEENCIAKPFCSWFPHFPESGIKGVCDLNLAGLVTQKELYMLYQLESESRGSFLLGDLKIEKRPP